MKGFLTQLVAALAGPPEPEPVWPGDDAPRWKQFLFFLAGGHAK